MICEEGNEVKSFLYLQDSLAKLHKVDESGRDHIISIAQPLDFIGFRMINSQVIINSHQFKGRVAHILLLFADNVYQNETYSLPISRKEVGELIHMSTEKVI